MNIETKVHKCRGQTCPIKKKCYRFWVRDNDWTLSNYLLTVPWNNSMKNCNRYISMDRPRGREY